MRPPSKGAIRSQVEQILKSETFDGVRRGKKLLQNIVAAKLSRSKISELSIAVDVFEKDTLQYDPKSDPIVRVAVRQLRARLQTYYTREGAGDLVIFTIPNGKYYLKAVYNAAALKPEVTRKRERQDNQGSPVYWAIFEENPNRFEAVKFAYRATVDSRGFLKLPLVAQKVIHLFGQPYRLYVVSLNVESIRLYPMETWVAIEETLANGNEDDLDLLMVCNHFGEEELMTDSGKVLLHKSIRSLLGEGCEVLVWMNSTSIEICSATHPIHAFNEL